MSSSRPTKGETKAAPALAASNAWAGEKQSVTLTRMPSSVSTRQAFSPSGVKGTLTIMLGATSDRRRPSDSMEAWSVAVTSALTGPGTMPQISAKTSKKSRPVLATSEGLVVTPSTKPVEARSWISATSAVSTKNFMSALPFLPWRLPLETTSAAPKDLCPPPPLL